MDKLKPCPFCGSKPKMYHYTVDRPTRHEVYCVMCDPDWFCDCKPHTRYHLSEEQAIDAWNRRVNNAKPM